MCLCCQEEIEIEQVSAFKLFSRDENGKLQSIFRTSYNKDLAYPANERIRVNDEESNFFAFAEKKHALGMAGRIRRPIYGFGKNYRWNVVKGDPIVLPVTLFEVVKEGKFHVPSSDVQCLDGYYPVYESKEIIVHDTVENRNDFYDEIIRRFFRSNQYNMSKTDKEAIKARLPHAAKLMV